MVFFSKNSLSFSDEAEKSLDSSDEQNKTNKKKSNTKSNTNGNDLECFDGSSEQESYDGNKIKSLDNKAKEKLAIQLIRNGMRSVSKEEEKKMVDKEESDIEEIEVMDYLVKRSASVFQCALCPKKFGDYGSFGGHVREVHKMKWPDYLNTHGRCEVESAPFECKICGSVVHYSGIRIDSHLKNVHKITWAEYIDYIRSMQRREQLKELPKIDVYTCKICNASVKFIKEHLKSTHKVTEHSHCAQEHFKYEQKCQKKETSRRTNVRSTIYVVNLEEMCLILVENLIVCVCCS